MNESHDCPFCHRSDRQVKAGMNGELQRYKCGLCGRRYTLTPHKRGYSEDVRNAARDMRSAGSSIGAIATACGVSRRTVSDWLHQTPEPTQAAVIPSTPTQPPLRVRTSIKQVAERAGVSVSTVSNFLNSSGRMSEATHERIRLAVEELHFSPNSLVKAIRNKRTRILGLITYGIGDLDAPYSITGGLLQGINDATVEADYDFLVYTNWFQAEKHYTGLSFVNGHVDGLIWAAPSMEEPLLERVAAAGLPVVALLSRHVPDGVGYVNSDNIDAVTQVVHHLLELGHRRIVYMGPAHSSNYIDRHTGFWSAV